MTVVALLLLLWLKQRVARSALRIVVLVGIATVACCSTPLPLWIQAVWGAQAFICMAVLRSGAARRQTLPHAVFLVMLSAGLCAWEATYRVLPRIHVAQGQTVYVIGDSISAGIGGRSEKAWPLVLAEQTHLKIVNLARPGATLATAQQQAREIRAAHALVFVEIGGNDLLSSAPPAYFRVQLDALLSKLRAGGDSIVIFELPLFPFDNGIGEAQRSLAAQYRAPLIPKRCMASIIALKGGTVDGLHFSQEGHDAFARLVKSMLVIDPGSP